MNLLFWYHQHTYLQGNCELFWRYHLGREVKVMCQELRSCMSCTYFINGFTFHEIDATLEYICTM